MKKVLLTTAALAAFIPGAALASNLVAVNGTMKNVESAIDTAIKQSEALYEQHGGQDMDKPINMLQSGPGSNPYIDVLRINTDYRIEFKFADEPKNTRENKIIGEYTSVPVANALLGKEIVLLPVHRKQDAKVSSWECLTNADKNVAEFMNHKGTPNLTASFIRSNTSHPYLSMCIYVNQQSLMQ